MIHLINNCRKGTANELYFVESDRPLDEVKKAVVSKGHHYEGRASLVVWDEQAWVGGTMTWAEYAGISSNPSEEW